MNEKTFHFQFNEGNLKRKNKIILWQQSSMQTHSLDGRRASSINFLPSHLLTFFFLLTRHHTHSFSIFDKMNDVECKCAA